jgi:hypothetical protein
MNRLPIALLDNDGAVPQQAPCAPPGQPVDITLVELTEDEENVAQLLPVAASGTVPKGGSGGPRRKRRGRISKSFC